MKCAWSPDNNYITCGSSDRYVYAWEVSSRRIVYKLPGHQGSVNATDFHPKEPICKFLKKLLDPIFKAHFQIPTVL